MPPLCFDSHIRECLDRGYTPRGPFKGLRLVTSSFQKSLDCFHISIILEIWKRNGFASQPL
jgi:hypothetical protein